MILISQLTQNKQKFKLYTPEILFNNKATHSKPVAKYSKSMATVLPDGVIINERKYFLQIKQPDLSQLAPMPQVPIDTTTHYHIQIIGEVKEKK